MPQKVALPIEDRERILTESILARVCTLNVCVDNTSVYEVYSEKYIKIHD